MPGFWNLKKRGKNGKMKKDILLNEWTKEENLMLLQCWARDGYTIKDIANRIGIEAPTLNSWRRKNEDIAEALSKGKEYVDYQVENALLKSALGYKTKEVKVTTTIRGGFTVETIKETLTKEQSPNVSAIQTWLYNRRPDKWRNMNSRANIVDDLEENESVEITISRAKQNELEDEDTELNESVKMRKRTDKEKQQKTNEKQHKTKENNKKSTKIQLEPEYDDIEGE